MGRGRARVRTAAVQLAIVAMVAVGLGVTAVPTAEASCPGPQLRLEQDGFSIGPRRVGEGLDEQLLYDVDRTRPLQVHAVNLTFGCNDTLSGTPGCGARATEPVEPLPPIRNANLQVEQRHRRWTVARVDAGPDLSSDLEVTLPAGLSAGSALLFIKDPENGDYAQLALVLS